MPLPYLFLRDFRLYAANPTFGNPPWGEASLRVLVVRLSPFADVQRSTPHVVLAQEIRRVLPDAFIDMAFLPGERDMAALTGAGIPPLTGTQSHYGLREFDLVLVSNSWLLEQVNLPFLLSASGIPLWASARGPEWPLIILGGSNASAAHAMITESGDCMADAVFFGEGEGRIGRIALLSRALAALPKAERIRRIASEVTGLWPAGDLSLHVERAVADAEPDADPRAPAGAAVTDAAFILPGPEAATARLSITHGCPCLCSFCFEGHDRKPFREIPVARLLAEARELKMATGADTLEIESNNFNTHTGIAELLPALQRLFLRVNLMSQRVDILARTPGLLELEYAADKRSFTLGVEGISDRLRAFLHKSLSDGEIRRVLESIHGRGTREIKLFYILTGGETDKDLAELDDFVQWLREVRQRADSPPRAVFSFGCLVRMPFTPLRHDPPVLEEQAWRGIAGRVKSICETGGVEFRLAMDWPRYAATQALALGGRDLSPLLLRLARGGPVGDAPLSPDACEAVSDWIRGHAEAAGRPVAPGNARPPMPRGPGPRGLPVGFPFLDTEESAARLRALYDEATAGRDEGYCRRGAPDGAACAACVTGCTRRPPRTDRRAESLNPAASGLARLMHRKHHLRPVLVPARLPRSVAGFGAEWTNAWLLRTLLSRHPEQIENVLAAAESFVGASGVIGEETPWFGETLVAVTAWDAASIPRGAWDAAETSATDADAAVPAAFKRVRLLLTLPVALFPDPAARLAVFLRDMHAPVTLSREGNLQVFTVPSKSLKKKTLLAGTCAESDAGHLLDLTVGSKPFLPQWLRSFNAARAALVEIREIG